MSYQPVKSFTAEDARKLMANSEVMQKIFERTIETIKVAAVARMNKIFVDYQNLFDVEYCKTHLTSLGFTVRETNHLVLEISW